MLNDISVVDHQNCVGASWRFRFYCASYAVDFLFGRVCPANSFPISGRRGVKEETPVGELEEFVDKEQLKDIGTDAAAKPSDEQLEKTSSRALRPLSHPYVINC